MAREKPIQLIRDNLLEIGKSVRIPTYDPVPPGFNTIVHLSVGNFHRAHQAVYLDDLLEAGKSEKWHLIGVGLLPFDIPARDAMQVQDCLYTLVERDAKGDNARVIASIAEYYYAPEKSEEVLSAMASATCKIVSMTITEGGYFVHQGTGEFHGEHPDIQHDLANPKAPKSSFGYILEALKRRKAAGVPPFTILSCDNMQSNGDVTKKMITAFAQIDDPELAAW